VYIANAGLGHNAGLRLGLPLSLLSGRPLRLSGLVDDQPRPRPGLGPGGLTAALAAARVSQGRFQGELGAGSMEFTSGRVQPGDYAFDLAGLMPSAAPLSLVLETLLLPLAAAQGPSGLILRGGSHVPGGPTSDELAQVLVPDWQALGLKLNYSEIAPGFFPAGGGEAEIHLQPAGRLEPLQAEGPFQPRQVGVEVLIAGLPLHLAEQTLRGALERLEVHGLSGRGNIRRARGGKGQALLVWAGDGRLRVGFTALGRRGERPEALAVEAVETLTGFLRSGAALPADTASRLLLALACAQGVSRLMVSHASRGLKAAVETIEAFWPGTVLLGRSRPNEALGLRVQGRDWGRAL